MDDVVRNNFAQCGKRRLGRQKPDRVEERRGRLGETSLRQERGNETGKIVIAHGSVEPAKRHRLA